MSNFYTFALLELFLHCYTLGKNTLRFTPVQFYPGQNVFTLALLVLLVTNFMSVHDHHHDRHHNGHDDDQHHHHHGHDDHDHIMITMVMMSIH